MSSRFSKLSSFSKPDMSLPAPILQLLEKIWKICLPKFRGFVRFQTFEAIPNLLRFPNFWIWKAWKIIGKKRSHETPLARRVR